MTNYLEPVPPSAEPAVPRAPRVYLDANASERPRAQALDAARAALDAHGNPASIHQAGRTARRRLEDARDAVAAACRVTPDRVVFTSGGTEAASLAIHGLGAGRTLLVGATEHPAILAAAGPHARTLPVTPDGTVDLDRLDALLAQTAPPVLVCLMAANNETGILHPIAQALSICRRHGARLHVDAVQLPGRMPIPDAILAADGVSLSAHKQGGIPGAGALLLGDGVELDRPLMPGGGQEFGRRGGTPPLAAIAAFAAAAAIPPPDHLARLRDRLEARAVASGAIALGAASPRLPNTSCLALPGRSAATQLIALDLAGFEVSAGSACSSGRVGASHVLAAMGAGSLAAQAIRVSLCWDADDRQIEAFAAAYADMAERTAA